MIADHTRHGPTLALVPRPAHGRSWQPHEDAVLVARYGRGPAVAIATDLGRTVPAVCQRALQLGITAHRVHARWRPADDRVLRDLHGVLPISAIGERMGRTPGSVKERVARLGLDRDSSAVARYQRDQDEIARLRGEVQRLRDRPPPDAAHAPSDDARRLATLVAWRLSVISAAQAAVVLGVPVERLPVELGKAAKRGLDVVTQALSGEGR